MNANELADYLDNNVEAMIMSEQQYIDQAATMLRQQQAEIAELKHMNRNWQISEGMALAEIEALKYEKSSGVYQGKYLEQYWVTQQSDEPVAWMYQDDESRSVAFYRDTLPCGAIPLYTHPANLTDEVINKLWAESSEDGIAMQQGFTTQQHYFAHLLLRKAQEK